MRLKINKIKDLEMFTLWRRRLMSNYSTVLVDWLVHSQCRFSSVVDAGA